MSREGLNHHLYHWAIRSKLLPNPGPIPKAPHSVYIAAIFENDPELVMTQARKYWRSLVEEQHA